MNADHLKSIRQTIAWTLFAVWLTLIAPLGFFVGVLSFLVFRWKGPLNFWFDQFCWFNRVFDWAVQAHGATPKQWQRYIEFPIPFE